MRVKIKRNRKVLERPTSIVCIGVDPSLNGTALAVVVDGKLRWIHGWTDKKVLQKRHPDVLSYLKLKESTELTRQARLDLMSDWVLEQIDRWVSHASELYIGIEGYAFAKNNSNRATDLHELGGLIKQGLWESKIPYRIYTPTQIKKAWTGNGTADKSIMILTAFKQLDLDCGIYDSAGENLADASLIAYLMHTEVELRAGRLRLNELNNHVRETFIQVTKNEPEALLTRPLISQQNVSDINPVIGNC